MDAGVLVVDKPAGPTSFDVVDAVRRARGARRAGHTGTLDPAATGVLPVCIGEATKLVPYLIGGDKSYRAEILLGVETDTLDAAGRVLATRDASGVTEEALRAALASLTGRIRQVPPMFSAVRKAGRRLHELARRGEEVEREPREVVVHALAIESFAPPRVTLRADVGKGTYVRSLAADLGARLGCGAHLASLRRLRAGPFTIEQAVPLADAATAPLLSPSDALAHLPAVAIDGALVARVRAGAPLPRDLPSPAGLLRVVGSGDELIAVAERDEAGLRLRRVMGPTIT